MSKSTPRLRAETVRLEREIGWQLLANLPSSPTCFIRHGDGIAGFGESARIAAVGPNRVEDLSLAWRELAAEGTVVDAIALPGTGLVAFGTIAFADDSRSESVLVIPSVVIAMAATG